VAKAPEKPRRSSAPGPSSTRQRRRSHLGRIVAAGIGIASTGAVMTGLNMPVAEKQKVCGGFDRWSVKVANDPDANAISLNPVRIPKVAQASTFKPGPIDAGGRMDVEKKTYTVSGYLSYFKKEDDGDFHVVITDKPGDFVRGATPPNGRSLVVEFPDSDCFAGSHKSGPTTSILGQAIAEARTTFKAQTNGIDGEKIKQAIPVTVTGVGFFDRDHGHQVGRTIPQHQQDGRPVVFELHPVTEITFDNQSEPD
jgi:hypothetical protein